MVGVCQAEEFQAIALAKSSAGTRLATSAPEAGPKKARATPNTASTAKIGPARSMPRIGQQQDRQRAERLEERRQRHDQPAAEAVGRGTCHQHQHQRRQELDDADESEIERIAGQVVDLPADGDRDDLRRKGREKPRRPVAQEGAMAEGGIALVGGVSVVMEGPGGLAVVMGSVGAGRSYLAQIGFKRRDSRRWPTFPAARIAPCHARNAIRLRSLLRLQDREDAVGLRVGDVFVVRRGEADAVLRSASTRSMPQPSISRQAAMSAMTGKVLAQPGSTSITEPPMVGSSFSTTLQPLSPDWSADHPWPVHALQHVGVDAAVSIGMRSSARCGRSRQEGQAPAPGQKAKRASGHRQPQEVVCSFFLRSQSWPPWPPTGGGQFAPVHSAAPADGHRCKSGSPRNSLLRGMPR